MGCQGLTSPLSPASQQALLRATIRDSLRLPLPKSVEMRSTASTIAARIALGCPAPQPTAARCVTSWLAALSEAAVPSGAQGSKTSRNLSKKLRSGSLQYCKQAQVLGATSQVKVH